MGWNENKLYPHTVALAVMGGVAVAALSALIIGWIVMILWNWLVPDIFSLKPIGYWQGFGLVLLARLLVGNIQHGGKKGRRSHNANGATPCHVKKKIKESVGSEYWKPLGSYHNWKHYENYWREEGKDAFELWLKKGQDGE